MAKKRFTISQEEINQAPRYFQETVLGDFYSQGIDCWVAGGCIRDYFLGVMPLDYDIYFPDQQNFDKARAYLESQNAKLDWDSENGCKFSNNGKVYDLIKIYRDSPEQTIERFDFTTAMFCIEGDNLYAGDTSFDDLESMVLKVNYITFPESTLKRTLRYYDKGFRMPAEEAVKMVGLIKKIPSETENKKYSNFSSLSGDTTPPNKEVVIENGDLVVKTNEPTPKTIKPKKDVPDYLPYIVAGVALLLLVTSQKLTS
jgi:hypothetical protein